MSPSLKPKLAVLHHHSPLATPHLAGGEWVSRLPYYSLSKEAPDGGMALHTWRTSFWHLDLPKDEALNSPVIPRKPTKTTSKSHVFSIDILGCLRQMFKTSGTFLNANIWLQDQAWEYQRYICGLRCNHCLIYIYIWSKYIYLVYTYICIVNWS